MAKHGGTVWKLDIESCPAEIYTGDGPYDSVALVYNVADARMMAAAPGMMDVLENIVSLEEPHPTLPEWLWKDIYTVLAKAKDESIPTNDDLYFPRFVVNRPSAFAAVKLAPEPQCYCGHTKLEHRIDKTCGKVPCLCIRFEIPGAPEPPESPVSDAQGNEHAEV